MSRTNRRRALRAVAPVAGLLAAGLLVWQGSYAAFSATTTNEADSWEAGTLTLTNNGGTDTFAATTGALITAQNIKPGDTQTRCLTVDSTGTSGGALAMYRGTVTNTAGIGGAVGLSDRLGVTVRAAVLGAGETVVSSCAADGLIAGSVNFPGTSTVVANALLDNLPTAYGPAAKTTITAGQRVAYQISWTFNSGGSTTADNPYQGAKSVADLVWEIQ